MNSSLNATKNPQSNLNHNSPCTTPKPVRPISQLHASTKSSRSGTSRILTSSTEKRRINQLTTIKKNFKTAKRALTFSQKRTQQAKKKKPKRKPQLKIESSDESTGNISYADTIDSNGFPPDDEGYLESRADDLETHKITDDDNLTVGDYVLVKFQENIKNTVFDVGQIIETFGNCTYNIKFFRLLQVWLLLIQKLKIWL